MNGLLSRRCRSGGRPGHQLRFQRLTISYWVTNWRGSVWFLIERPHFWRRRIFSWDIWYISRFMIRQSVLNLWWDSTQREYADIQTASLIHFSSGKIIYAFFVEKSVFRIYFRISTHMVLKLKKFWKSTELRSVYLRLRSIKTNINVSI